MKRIAFIVLCLCSVTVAQDRWVGQDSIWQYGDGGSFQMLDPCFGPDSNSVLVKAPRSNRIMRLNYLDADTLLPFLPESLSVEGYADMSPFLTFDGRSLYFSSDRPGGYGGYDLWVSRRVNDEWQMPTNLGVNINSDLDEGGPSLTANGNELYFYRHSTEFYPVGYIAKSTLIDNQWTVAQALPAPVNSEYGERDPAISPDGQYLYFISLIPMNTLDRSAWVCRRVNDGWSERNLLDGFVNLIWEICAFMPEGNPWSVAIDESGRKLLYTKEEVYECFDPEYRVYMSYLATGVDDNSRNMPQSLSLSLYPNPFNSSLEISIDGAVSEIAIYDILGKRIRSFSDVASNIVTWDGRSDGGVPCTSGMYFVRATAGERTIVKAATLLK